MKTGKENNNFKHGMSLTKFYGVWASMLRRCDNKTQDSYKLYGGRGISVCDKWLDFKGFLEDMKNGYAEGLSLDRIDNNGNYCKENCQWVTKTTQANNRRNSNFLQFRGKRKTWAEWAELTGITYAMIKLRLRRGWSIEKTLLEKRKINQFV